MARMPYASSSSERLINIGRRCGRLCAKAGNGAQKYSGALDDPMNDLDQKRNDTGVKKLDADAALDSAVQSDRALDDAIRTAFEKCAQYERELPATQVLEKIFPSGTITPIINAPRDKQLDKTRQIVNRITELGGAAAPTNGTVPTGSKVQLADVAKELGTVLDAAIKARDEHTAKRLAYSDAQTTEALARKRFVEQYSATYHTACCEMGLRLANSLFPNFVVNKTTAPAPAPVPAPAPAAADVAVK